jgi:hypothetical protein
VEFGEFLRKLDSEVPDDLEFHLVLDHPSTHRIPAIKCWLPAHPRFVQHFTSTSSSWLNLVERWFAEPRPPRSCNAPRTARVDAPNGDIRTWAESWNANPSPTSAPRPPTISSTASAIAAADFLTRH